MSKLLIDKGWVIPMASSQATIIENGAVAIEDERIVSIGTSEEVKKSGFIADIIIDADGKAILPGLINTHTHLVGGFNKGITEDVPRTSGGLFNIIFPLHEHYVKREDVYYPGLVHGMEMLMTGTTTINETWWYASESARIVKDLGIRAVISEMLREMDSAYLSPTNLERDWDQKILEQGFDEAIRLIEEWHGKDNGRITCRVAPFSPDTLTEKGLLRSRDLAEKYGLGLHVHLAEIPGENEYVQKAYGKSPVELMRDLGMLGEHFIGVHVVFVSDSDIQILADTHTKVSHTPFLVAKRGYFPPIEKFYQAGVDVSLGSDWCSNDLWTIMRTAILFARVRSGDVRTLSAYDALSMATIRAAQCLNMDNHIGSLEGGKKADVILVDMKTPWCNPIRKQNIISNLVYNANGGDVIHVIVDGKIVVENGVLKTLDQYEVMSKAQEVAEKIWNSADVLFN